MKLLIKFIRKITILLALCTFSTAVADSSDQALAQNDSSPTVFSLDLRKPEYKTSFPCVITHDKGTEFNPTCGRSWKFDKYDSDTNEFSFMEIELNIDKDLSQEYALELLACARKDFPLTSNVTITVNDRVIAQGYHMYNGPDSIHFPDEMGLPSHLRWDVFEITNELQQGMNKIKISLDRDTQSGISVSWLHIRSTPRVS